MCSDRNVSCTKIKTSWYILVYVRSLLVLCINEYVEHTFIYFAKCTFSNRIEHLQMFPAYEFCSNRHHEISVVVCREILRVCCYNGKRVQQLSSILTLKPSNRRWWLTLGSSRGTVWTTTTSSYNDGCYQYHKYNAKDDGYRYCRLAVRTVEVCL